MRKIQLIIFILFLYSKVFGQSVTYLAPYTESSFNVKQINKTLSVGSIAASADVSNGAASYSIPIVVPKGTNGVQPNLSISYSSTGGNGALGQGWGLSGLSAIVRSNNTITTMATPKNMILQLQTL